MKYDKMVAISKEKSKEKAEIAKIEIEKMLLRKERVTVGGLERITGFSNSFFYRNQEVKDAIKSAQLQQGECYNPTKVISDIVLERKVEFLKEKVSRMKKEVLQLERDKEYLLKKNSELKEAIDELRVEIQILKSNN